MTAGEAQVALLQVVGVCRVDEMAHCELSTWLVVLQLRMGIKWSAVPLLDQALGKFVILNTPVT